MSVQYHKVTPIYQCIEKSNWKGAVKLCQKKDVEKWDITKSLMAYCLLQLERTEQALAVCLEVKANEPTDEGALRALTLTFKAMNRPLDALECYENASRKCPSEESFVIETLNAYAGMGEFKKMQQGSQRLYKTTGKPQYVFWAVSCMLLQPHPLAMLDLAEKMLCKVFNGEKKAERPGGEELSLLVTILRNRAAHATVLPRDKCAILEHCLEIILDLSSRRVSIPIHDESTVKPRDGGDGSLVKSHPQHLQLLQIQILKDLQNYHHLSSTCETEPDSSSTSEESSKQQSTTTSMIQLLQDVLVDLPDQWDALQTLVQIHCDSHRRHTCVCTIGKAETNCINLFHSELLAMQDKHPSARGTFLAEIFYLQELQKGYDVDDASGWWHGQNAGDADPSLMAALSLADSVSATLEITPFQKEMIRLLMQYITKFETKQCCFTDVKPYLRTLLLPVSETTKQQGEAQCVSFTLTAAAQVMQSWAQQRACQLHKELSELTATSVHDEGSDLVKNATLLLCRLSKLLQIDCYFTINVSDTENQMTRAVVDVISDLKEVSVLKTLYADMYGLLAGKGIGGLREVQPGDELLMLCSADIWRRVRSPSCFLAPSSTSTYTATCLEWAETMLVGREASPHNYCFSVEALEPLRRLGCTEYALNGFNKLEVKHVQLDSMSYLMLPALLEGGLFTEFRQLSADIIKFHAGAKRDTLQMIGKCMKNANYAKSLELGKFVKKCQNSLQLALTRAELPLVEVLERLHTPAEILTYLQSYLTEGNPESQGELSITDVQNLDENMDYGLLTRIDEEHTNRQTTCSDTDSCNGECSISSSVYRSQYAHRIITNQSFVRLMVLFLQGNNIPSMITQLKASWTEHFGTMNSFGGLAPATADGGSYRTNLSLEAASTPSLSLQWSQAIDYGSSEVENNLWILVYRICYFSALCVEAASSRNAGAEIDDKDSNVDADTDAENKSRLAVLHTLGASIAQSFLELRAALVLREEEGQTECDVKTSKGAAVGAEGASRFVVSGHGGGKVLLQPAWIKMMSATVRLLICWGSVILSSARNQLGGEVAPAGGGKSAAKKKKQKKAKAAAAVASSGDVTSEGMFQTSVKDAFVAVTRAFKGFADDVSASLSTEMIDGSRTVTDVVAYLNSVLPPLPFDTATRTATTAVTRAKKESESGGSGSGNSDSSPVVDETGRISFSAARIHLAKHLLSSQTLSCTRLSDCLQLKVSLWHNFNNGI